MKKRTSPSRYDWTVRYMVRGDAGEQAEVRLVLAVLEEAIRCFRKYLLASNKQHRRLFRDAETWIMSDEYDLPYSFDHVCEVLGLNSGYVRRQLCRWRDRQLLEGLRTRQQRWPDLVTLSEDQSAQSGWSSQQPALVRSA